MRYTCALFLSIALMSANCGPAAQEVRNPARVTQVGEMLCFSRDDVPEAAPVCMPATALVQQSMPMIIKAAVLK